MDDVGEILKGEKLPDMLRFAAWTSLIVSVIAAFGLIFSAFDFLDNLFGLIGDLGKISKKSMVNLYLLKFHELKIFI